jgi:hypothetical protein
VDHPARVRGLVGRQPILALEYAESGIGMAIQQLARDREPEDASADHDEVAFGRWVGHGRPD